VPRSSRALALAWGLRSPSNGIDAPREPDRSAMSFWTAFAALVMPGLNPRANAASRVSARWARSASVVTEAWDRFMASPSEYERWEEAAVRRLLAYYPPARSESLTFCGNLMDFCVRGRRYSDGGGVRLTQRLARRARRAGCSPSVVAVN